jgi:DNA-binding NarL/FixJ family response regulator
MLVEAIRLVAAGAMWVDADVVRDLASHVAAPGREPPSLTKREEQVFQGVFEGLTNKEIAGRLDVPETTVKAVVQQLFRKTGVRTRGQLVRIALEGSFPWKR